MRGIWHADGDSFWIWDGYKAIHFQIAALLGIPLKECGLIVLSKNPKTDQIVMNTDPQHHEEIIKSPNIIKSLSKLDWIIR